MRKYLKTLVFLLLTTSVFANPIHKIWEAINSKDTDLAKSLIEKAIKDPTTKVDATLIKILLLTIEGEEENLSIFQEIYEDLEDPSAYLYALWFSDAVINDYAKKKKDRLAFLKKILADKIVNNAVKGDGNYVLSKHYEMINQLEKAIPIWDESGVVKNWSFVGPFDNTSKSGFEKQYAPIKEPSMDAVFKSKMNADIQWFTPTASNIESWTTSYFYINSGQAVNYGQTFVESEEDRNLTLSIGGSGNLKD